MLWRAAQGAVANFVESEQVVVLEDKQGNVTTSSFVHIRGSIALIRSQIPNINYKPPTRIAQPSASHPAFDHHFKELLETYQVIVLFAASAHAFLACLVQTHDCTVYLHARLYVYCLLPAICLKSCCHVTCVIADHTCIGLLLPGGELLPLPYA